MFIRTIFLPVRIKSSLELIVLVMIAAILSACTPGTQAGEPRQNETSADVSHGEGIGSYIDLVDVLRAQGATVVPAGGVEQPFFDVQGQLLQLNGTDVQVFEFADEASRKEVSDRIPPNASSIGTTMVTWVDQPNIWASGRLIVLYIGQDAEIIDLLTSVLGEPIAQGS